jgi:hypothetical protein
VEGRGGGGRRRGGKIIFMKERLGAVEVFEERRSVASSSPSLHAPSPIGVIPIYSAMARQCTKTNYPAPCLRSNNRL